MIPKYYGGITEVCGDISIEAADKILDIIDDYTDILEALDEDDVKSHICRENPGEEVNQQMKLYIQKGHGDEQFGYVYYLTDENGEVLNQHFCSNDGYAKLDLIRNHPEWEDAEIVLVSDQTKEEPDMDEVTIKISRDSAELLDKFMEHFYEMTRSMMDSVDCLYTGVHEAVYELTSAIHDSLDT